MIPCPPSSRASHRPGGPLSGRLTDSHYTVRDIYYSVHTKQGADEDAPKTMRVDYKVGFHEYRSEWICFEHSGFARWKAEKWWLARSRDKIPATAQQAVDIASAGGVAWTKAITVRSVAGEKFDRIVDYELDEKPEPVPIEQYEGYEVEDIPF